MNLLIVDDHPTNMKLLRAQLEAEGHAVFEAHDGVDALALLERQRVDAVISDILMPRMDGYRLCHEIRKHARLRDLPIIIYSSTYTSPEDEKLALEMGADKYLKKPASVATLVAALHEVVAQPHAAPRPDALREVEVLKNYNERLVSKLKEKNTELQAQTEALRASEERYRLLFERAPDVIFALAPMGAIASLNHAFETITGWPPAQWLGRPFQELIHPDDQTRAGELFQLVLGRERVPTFELRMRTVAGGFRDVEFTGFSNELSGGRIEVQGIGRDITERKQAEESLRESEEKYRTLVETSAEAILIAQDSMLKFVNRMASEITGYSEQELRSSPFLDFIHPDDREMVGERYLSRLKGDVSQPRYAFRLINKDGSIKWVEINGVLVAWEGKPATLNFLSDITNRKQGEEELRRAEDNFRRSLDDSPLGISIVSAKGETLYANRAILDLYGYADVEELRSTPVKKRYTPESYIEFQSRMKRRLNGEDSPSEYEINIIRKTGEIRCLQVSRKETVWDGQKQFQAIYQDITEHKKAEDKLRETLSGLRNALGGIIQVLSAVSEQRDPYTAGHQRRVADLAQAIAQELGLSPDRAEGIRVAGIIHDIGKMSIPAEILSKPTRLSEIEYKMIQSHAQIGHDILGDVKFAWPIANIILQHHERMDGSGYPQGLKGDDILLESRILAVSDVIEAMASHRPYRPALGIEAALKEIENNKGVLYDPAVVSACLTLFREKGYALKE
jgi:PAS domain S-box-containing protein/putative nucleotidyltransferase with HDIG domain